MTKTFSVGTFIALFFVLSVGISAHTAHAAALTRQLDRGDTGSDVTSLQTYLATNGDIYPSGRITGYFGSLTQAGVQRFQSSQGIVTNGTPASTGYGRVGPVTLARINSLMGMGTTPVSSGTVPVMSATTLRTGTTGATVTWTTNEPTLGQVYVDFSPIRADEATGPGQTPYISGTLATDGPSLQYSHTVTIGGLSSNTAYYYLVRSIDANGNITITWPSVSFRTN